MTDPAGVLAYLGALAREARLLHTQCPAGSIVPYLALLDLARAVEEYAPGGPGDWLGGLMVVVRCRSCGGAKCRACGGRGWVDSDLEVRDMALERRG